jgi:hypothetical protein
MSAVLTGRVWKWAVSRNKRCLQTGVDYKQESSRDGYILKQEMVRNKKGLHTGNV